MIIQGIRIVDAESRKEARRKLAAEQAIREMEEGEAAADVPELVPME